MNFSHEMQQIFFLGGAAGILVLIFIDILVLIFIEWMDRKWPH